MLFPKQNSTINTVMNKTTTTVHTIKVEFDDLKKRFYDSSLEMLTENLEDSAESFEHDIKKLYTDIHNINERGFTNLFDAGYTMVLLSGEEFEFVDRFFDRLEPSSEEELVIAIMRNGVVIEEVKHEYISY